MIVTARAEYRVVIRHPVNPEKGFLEPMEEHIPVLDPTAVMPGGLQRAEYVAEQYREIGRRRGLSTDVVVQRRVMAPWEDVA